MLGGEPAAAEAGRVVIEFVAALGVFLILLVVLGICADSWDARELRRDARRRNPYPRRTRDQARRVR